MSKLTSTTAQKLLRAQNSRNNAQKILQAASNSLREAIFEAVSEGASKAEIAEMLGVTQPAVSQQIQSYKAGSRRVVKRKTIVETVDENQQELF